MSNQNSFNDYINDLRDETNKILKYVHNNYANQSEESVIVLALCKHLLEEVVLDELVGKIAKFPNYKRLKDTAIDIQNIVGFLEEEIATMLRQAYGIYLEKKLADVSKTPAKKEKSNG